MCAFKLTEHETSGRKSISPQPPTIRNIVAVAQTNCLPVVEESNALAFKKGDTVVVHEKRGDGLYIGTCHGRTGSFLAEDVIFYSRELILNAKLIIPAISFVKHMYLSGQP